MNVLCIIKHYINIPVTVMVLLTIIKWTRVDFFDYVRNEAMLVLVFYFFQKSMIFSKILAKLVFGKSTFFNIPGHCHGPSKYYINFPVTVMVLLKMGPRGLGPNPFSTVSQNSYYFFGISGVPKKCVC